MGYVTAGRLGTLSDHLVKPPEREDDAPKNVIPSIGVAGGSLAGLDRGSARGT